MSLKIVRIINAPLSSNCFILYALGETNCIVVDPGSENSEIILFELEKLGVVPQYIILTHEHFDHIWSVNPLIDKYPNCVIVCSDVCLKAIKNSKLNHSLFYNQIGFIIKECRTFLIQENSILKWSRYDILFLQTEGHTTSGISVIIDKFLFTGDTLIKDIKTVTKLFCGSKESLQISINKYRLLQGRNLIVCPGHGDSFSLDEYNLLKAL